MSIPLTVTFPSQHYIKELIPPTNSIPTKAGRLQVVVRAKFRGKMLEILRPVFTPTGRENLNLPSYKQKPFSEEMFFPYSFSVRLAFTSFRAKLVGVVPHENRFIFEITSMNGYFSETSRADAAWLRDLEIKQPTWEAGDA